MFKVQARCGDLFEHPVWGLGFRFRGWYGVGVRVYGYGIRVSNLRFRVSRVGGKVRV